MVYCDPLCVNTLWCEHPSDRVQHAASIGMGEMEKHAGVNLPFEFYASSVSSPQLYVSFWFALPLHLRRGQPIFDTTPRKPGRVGPLGKHAASCIADGVRSSKEGWAWER